MARIVETARPALAGLRYIGLIAALAPAPAHAGAWIAPENGQTIWTEVAGAREGAFFSESAYYYEVPIKEDFAFVTAPWLTQDPGQGSGLDALRWEVTIAAKAAVRRGEHSVMAVQAGAVWYSDPMARCGEAGAELRWLGGLALGENGRAFANAEAAERAGAGGCGGERADLTFGYRPGQRWLGLAQVFTDLPHDGDAAVRAQLSMVHLGEGQRGLQVGLRARVDGGEAEPALVLGFWGAARDD